MYAKFALLLAALLASAAGFAGPEHPPGVAMIEVNHAGRNAASAIWYEAAGDAAAQTQSIRLPLRPIPLARNAAPAPNHGRRALIVLSHGNWGGPYSQAWLAARLVAAGFVVLSTSHPGTTGDDQSAAGRWRLWDRSSDVTAALTRLLEHPEWSVLVDPQRIGFAGHSFGGWTGVSLAGGRYDPLRQRAACETMAKKDLYCDSTLKDDLQGVEIADASASYADPRIKAFYLMAAGPAAGFSDASLQAIRAPFVVDTADFDEVLDARHHSSPLARRIHQAREIVRSAGHFAYVPLCRPFVGAIAARAAGLPICDDAPGVDRATVHRQVAADVVAFFDAVLRP
ncbi:MAG: hypothetical protein HZC37_18180 [Burkholderiales bacterium]|nr:hypothetical protein [Burkholderiales bacterium]